MHSPATKQSSTGSRGFNNSKKIEYLAIPQNAVELRTFGAPTNITLQQKQNIKSTYQIDNQVPTSNGPYENKKQNTPFKTPITPFKYFHRKNLSSQNVNRLSQLNNYQDSKKQKNQNDLNSNQNSIKNPDSQFHIPQLVNNDKSSIARAWNLSFNRKGNNSFFIGGLIEEDDSENDEEVADMFEDMNNYALIHSKDYEFKNGDDLYTDNLRLKTALKMKRRQIQRAKMRSEELVCRNNHRIPTTLDTQRYQQYQQRASADLKKRLNLSNRKPLISRKQQMFLGRNIGQESSVNLQDTSNFDQSQQDLSFGEGSPVRRRSSLNSQNDKITLDKILNSKNLPKTKPKESPLEDKLKDGLTEQKIKNLLDVFDKIDQGEQIDSATFSRNDQVAQTSIDQFKEFNLFGGTDIIYFNENMTTRDQSDSFNKSQVKRRRQLPLQNKKLKSMFGVPKRQQSMTENSPVSKVKYHNQTATSASISKFLQGIEVIKTQRVDDLKRLETPTFLTRKSKNTHSPPKQFTHPDEPLNKVYHKQDINYQQFQSSPQNRSSKSNNNINIIKNIIDYGMNSQVYSNKMAYQQFHKSIAAPNQAQEIVERLVEKEKRQVIFSKTNQNFIPKSSECAQIKKDQIINVETLLRQGGRPVQVSSASQRNSIGNTVEKINQQQDMFTMGRLYEMERINLGSSLKQSRLPLKHQRPGVMTERVSLIQYESKRQQKSTDFQAQTEDIPNL
ncbi:UNKNOWN [Stylonychia lemnae]|uniref:Uncharacterized protein n=1 Tax=Stylonychia lemnae TaxID=5949 RepID=A0A077ZUW3_STYLE|nr:UNKNOWN [Stylonychia lemnae]|eukprot:CDW73349.1 UNKNOWN [Stylonychia lemnae]